MGNVFPITGEGNGTPLQYSCLENPMDGGAGKVAVHRVAKSRTRLKRPSITAIFGFCDCFLICKSFESEATSPQEPFYPMDLCFFCLFVYICQSIYLFGFTGCQLQHAGFLIFIVTCSVFQLWHMGSSSQTRDWTQVTLHRSVKSKPLDHQGSSIQ